MSVISPEKLSIGIVSSHAMKLPDQRPPFKLFGNWDTEETQKRFDAILVARLVFNGIAARPQERTPSN